MSKNKLILIAIVIILIVVFILTNKPVVDMSGFSNDFENETLVEKSNIVIPEDVKIRFEKQLEESIEAQQTNENPYSAYQGEALNIMYLGDYKLALEKFEQLEDKYPNDYLASMNKGDLLIRMGQYLSAARAFQSAIDKKSVEPLNHIKLVDLYSGYSSNPGGAEKILLRALADTNKHKEIERKYAVFLEEVKMDYALSVEYWNEVLKKTSDPGSRRIPKFKALL